MAASGLSAKCTYVLHSLVILSGIRRLMGKWLNNLQLSDKKMRKKPNFVCSMYRNLFIVVILFIIMIEGNDQPFTLNVYIKYKYRKGSIPVTFNCHLYWI